MSYGKSMAIQGIASGRDRAREYRRQNEEDERVRERHAIDVDAAGRSKTMDEMSIAAANEQSERDRADRSIMESSRAMQMALAQFHTTGDPTPLVSAYNQHVPDGTRITGLETLDPGENGIQRYKLSFDSGTTQELDAEELGGMASMLSNPETLSQIKAARTQELREKQNTIAQEQRQLSDDKELETFRTDESIRATEARNESAVERARQEAEIAVEQAMQTADQEGDGTAAGLFGPARDLSTTDSNYFRNHIGALMGGKFEGGLFFPQEGTQADIAQATQLAESLAINGMPNALAAQTAYEAVRGPINLKDATKLAKAEWLSMSSDERKGKSRKEWEKNRADRMMIDSKRAKSFVEGLDLDQFQNTVLDMFEPGTENQQPAREALPTTFDQGAIDPEMMQFVEPG